MRWIFWMSTVVLTTIVALGLIRNNGSKFVRIHATGGCVSNYVNIHGPHSAVCCSGDADDEGVCFGGRNAMTKVLTSHWAFVIPLLALAVHAACDRLAGPVSAAKTKARLDRLFLYVGIILVRTFLLYMGLGYVQDLIQRDETANCWYSELRRTGKCSEHFDFADHVVLAVCQYFLIQVFEASCILQEYYDSRTSATLTAVGSREPQSVSSGRPGVRKASLLLLIPPLAVCVVVAGFSLVLMYDTAAFFHSRAETTAALLLSWFAVGSHMLSMLGSGSGSRVGSSRSRGVFLAPLVD